MKAIRYQSYGSPDDLHLEEAPTPVPAPNEVLIKVRAASVNPIDWHFLRGTPYGIRMMTGLSKPKNQGLGMDVAGEIVAMGSKVTRFRINDPVFGTARASFAEYACASETTIVRKPDAVTFAQAASIPVAGVTALQCLRDKARIQVGQKLLVNGASGGVGTFAVQLGIHSGAIVTAVCSTRNADMVQSLGARNVIDYTHLDFTLGAQRYDVIIDCIGNHSLAACRRVLTPKGMYLIVGGPGGRWIAPMDRVLRARLLSMFVSQHLAFLSAKITQRDLDFIAGLIASGKVTPVIDRTYPLPLVPSALRYLEEGHARGKVVIVV